MTQKYEREIEEILRNLDEFVPEEPLTRRATKRVGKRFSQFRLPPGNWRQYLTVQWLMVASISLIMLGFLVRAFSPAVAGYANILGFLLMLAAILMSVFHLGSQNRPRLWRGRVVEVSNYQNGWWASLQRRWRLWWRSRR